MKVIVSKNVVHRGKRYGVGETVDLRDGDAKLFVDGGLARYVDAPETAKAPEQKAKNKKGKATK